jgi:acid phosphatase
MKRTTYSAPFVMFFLAFALPSCTENIRYEALNATLWVQTSAEFRALAEQIYTVGQERLEAALEDRTWTAAMEQSGSYSHLPPAIIMDIDETVVGNAAFAAELVTKNKGFNRELWAGWVSRAQAKPIPGALDFVTHAHERGLVVFFVTNRDHATESATRDNLRRLGFPLNTDMDTVLTLEERPDWGWDKSSRRRFIADRFRILLLFGDDLNDFVSGAETTPEDRVKLAAKYESFWGERWLLIPNPIYGSWERSLYDFDRDLPSEKKFKMKYERLKPFR